MPLLPVELADRLLRSLVAVPLDEPGAVGAVDEAGHGLAELLDGVVQLDPQALLREGADPGFGAAVGLGFTQERRVVADAQPGQGAGEVGRAVLGSPVMPQRQAAGDVSLQAASGR
jgi:hypothetical protein